MGTAVDCAPLLKSQGLLGLQQLPGCCTTVEAAGLREAASLRKLRRLHGGLQG